MHLSATSYHPDKDKAGNTLTVELPDPKDPKKTQTCKFTVQQDVQTRVSTKDGKQEQVIITTLKLSPPPPAGWEWDDKAQTLKIPGDKVKEGDNAFMMKQGITGQQYEKVQVKASIGS